MSPDVNPIENLWEMVRKPLEKKLFKKRESLENAIKRQWKALPKKLAVKLVESMENRVSELIERKGAFLSY